MGVQVPIPEAERRQWLQERQDDFHISDDLRLRELLAEENGILPPFNEPYFNEFDGIRRQSYQARLDAWRAENHVHPKVRATQRKLYIPRDGNNQEALWAWYNELRDLRLMAMVAGLTFPDDVLPGYDRLGFADKERCFADIEIALGLLDS